MPTSGTKQGISGFAGGVSASYIEDLYQRFCQDPESVDPSWRHFFEGYNFASKATFTGGDVQGGMEAKVEAFINLYRRLGHLSADLNPLTDPPALKQNMLPEAHGLGGVDYEQEFHPANLPVDGRIRFSEIFALLKETYCGRIGADFRELNSVDAVVWLQEQMEGSRNRPHIPAEVKIFILDKLTKTEGFEKFLQDRYLGQKRFSLEGLDALIPLMDVIADEAAGFQVEELCMGMAHRGRLNVLANFMGKPYELMLKEFEDSEYNVFDIDGDVKYHKGFASYIDTMSGRKLRAYLSPNPSHLEAVNPVVEGFARARQQLLGDKERRRVMPVLIHGDASFIGQGIVAETLNLSELGAYTTGGTVHIITNNQVGFTTNPEEGRSCVYSSDIAKMVRAPVFHVNADDPEAVIWTAKLAVAYRQKFQKDVVIDLIGYRRHGHNETDEPGFTQPTMYKVIKDHPTVLTLYTKRLVSEGVISKDAAEEKNKVFRDKLQDCLERVRKGNLEILITVPKELEVSLKLVKATEEDMFKKVKTSVPTKTLQDISKAITTTPSGFTPHPKIAKLLKSRSDMMKGEGAIDWGMAELLAYGSLASEGHHVRLSGQDCRRGTFSHRHGVIKDFETGEPLNLFSEIGSGGMVDIINSPLSEQGVLGFEFGFAVADRDALVLWEAQFGDFSNGGQIIIDQFLAASEAKWKQACGLVLLLPHGYEGMGPEHSSARPERFLQLCGNHNMQLANCTTPAQLFHLLRRQLLRDFRKPLVVMTPKSLLRHPKVISTVKDLGQGSFSEVLKDESVTNKKEIEKIIFCSGKVFYELDQAREDLGEDTRRLAIVRIEQVHPFPKEQVQAIIDDFSSLKEVTWVQEEPYNMGCWGYVRSLLEETIPAHVSLKYCGRKSAGSTAEGSLKSHQKEQQRIIYDALGMACSVDSKKKKSVK